MNSQPNVALLSLAELRVLRALDEASEPRFNSDVFSSLIRKGLMSEHPYELTDAGRARLLSGGS